MIVFVCSVFVNLDDDHLFTILSAFETFCHFGRIASSTVGIDRFRGTRLIMFYAMPYPLPSISATGRVANSRGGLYVIDGSIGYFCAFRVSPQDAIFHLVFSIHSAVY